MAEEERDGAQLHTGLAGGEWGRLLRERGGGRGVQQTAGPRHGRREDPTAAAKTPQSFLSTSPGTASPLKANARSTGRCTITPPYTNKHAFSYTQKQQQQQQGVSNSTNTQ